MAEDICIDCRLPVAQHNKDGYCPVEWMASWTDITRRENIVLRKKLAEKEAHDRRWEMGFRSITFALNGDRDMEFDIPDVVERVKQALKEGRNLQVAYDREREAHKADRQVIIEHTEAEAVVKTWPGAHTTDPMDDRFFEVACQIVMRNAKEPKAMKALKKLLAVWPEDPDARLTKAEEEALNEAREVAR